MATGQYTVEDAPQSGSAYSIEDAPAKSQNPFARMSPSQAIAAGGSPADIQSATQGESKSSVANKPMRGGMYVAGPQEEAKIEGKPAPAIGAYANMGEEHELAEGAPVGAAGLVTLGSGGGAASLLPEIGGVSGAAATGAATGGASGAAGTVTHQLLNRQNPFRVRNLEDTGENALIGAGTGAAAGVASVAPKTLRPAVRFILPRVGHAVTGAIEGKYAGQEAGNLVGKPAEGGTAGAVLGGGYGLITGRDPGVSIVARAGRTLGKTFGAGLREGMENAEPVQVGGPRTRTADEPVSREPMQQKSESVVAGPSRPPAVEIPAPQTQRTTPIRTPTQVIARQVDDATGNTPVVRGVPLRDQPRMAVPKSLSEKYPDKTARQWIHVNGEEMYAASKSDPKVMRGIHEMNRVDLRQALINSGEDMGDRVVSDSKFAGEGAVPRQAAFRKLLAKGYSPKQIIELGKKTISSRATVVPPRPAIGAEEQELVQP